MDNQNSNMDTTHLITSNSNIPVQIGNPENNNHTEQADLQQHKMNNPMSYSDIQNIQRINYSTFQLPVNSGYAIDG